MKPDNDKAFDFNLPEPHVTENATGQSQGASAPSTPFAAPVTPRQAFVNPLQAASGGAQAPSLGANMNPPAIPMAGSTPTGQADEDLVRRMVYQLRGIVQRTGQDPYQQCEELRQLKSTYMNKVLHKEININETSREP